MNPQGKSQGRRSASPEAGKLAKCLSVGWLVVGKEEGAHITYITYITY